MHGEKGKFLIALGEELFEITEKMELCKCIEKMATVRMKCADKRGTV